MGPRRLNRRRVLAGLLSPLVLTGCTIPGTARWRASDPNTVDLWYWNRSIDDTLFREFEHKHPGVTINDQKIGGDYASRVNTTLAGEAFVPAIMAFNYDISRYFRAEDEFVDLLEYGAANVAHEYLEWKWQLGITDSGRMIGFPMDTGPTALFYRADFFEQAGLPSEPADVSAMLATWDDYLDAGVEVQKALPEVRFLDNIPNLYFMALSQSSTFYVDREGRFVGDGDHIRRAWDIAMAAFNQGLAAHVNAFTPDWSAALNTNRVATFVGAVWMKQILMESAPDTAGAWRVAQCPDGPGNQGGSFIGITRYAPDKALAYELIRFVQSPENQARMYESLNLFPSALDALRSPVMDQPEEFFGGQATSAEFVRAAETLDPFYFSPAFPIAHGVVMEMVTDVAVGGRPEAGAWEEAQEQLRRELKHKAPWVKWENN